MQSRGTLDRLQKERTDVEIDTPIRHAGIKRVRSSNDNADLYSNETGRSSKRSRIVHEDLCDHGERGPSICGNCLPASATSTTDHSSSLDITASTSVLSEISPIRSRDAARSYVPPPESPYYVPSIDADIRARLRPRKKKANAILSTGPPTTPSSQLGRRRRTPSAPIKITRKVMHQNASATEQIEAAPIGSPSCLPFPDSPTPTNACAPAHPLLASSYCVGPSDLSYDHETTSFPSNSTTPTSPKSSRHRGVPPIAPTTRNALGLGFQKTFIPPPLASTFSRSPPPPRSDSIPTNYRFSIHAGVADSAERLPIPSFAVSQPSRRSISKVAKEVNLQVIGKHFGKRKSGKPIRESTPHPSFDILPCLNTDLDVVVPPASRNSTRPRVRARKSAATIISRSPDSPERQPRRSMRLKARADLIRQDQVKK
jgi:hypothetical protein